MYRALGLLIVLGAPLPVNAVHIEIDYTYAGSFFSTGTTHGQQARASVEAAADYFSGILDDSFSQIVTPDPFVGQQSTQTWTWNVNFANPSGSGNISLTDPSIAADEYRLYVGGESIPGTTIGVGGSGGWGYSSSTNGPGFFPNELTQINAISDAFSSAIETRGETSGFANWGGSLSFDSSVNWNYNHLANPVGSQNDLFSVALHEMGHTIGISGSSEWNALVSGSQFQGGNAATANGGTFPTVTADGHWTAGTTSTVFGGTASQEAAMDPDLTTGTRKLWTTLDAAGLQDIGWTVLTPVAPGLTGDYTDDNQVDAADYTVWRDSLGTGSVIGSYAEWRDNYGASSTSGLTIPEPTAALLLVIGLTIIGQTRKPLGSIG